MLLDNILRLVGIENRHTSGNVVTGAGLDNDAALKRVFGGSDTLSGVAVNQENATTLSAVYAAVRLLSWTPGILPWGVFQTAEDGVDRNLRKDHPVYPLLNKRPNPEMSASVWVEIGQSFVLLWGHSYNYIERNQAGQPTGLWPMHPSQVQLGRAGSGERIYGVRNVNESLGFRMPPFAQGTKVLSDDEVLHVQNFGGNSVIAHAREQMGEAISAQRFGAGFFAGGAVPDIALKHPSKFKGDGAERLRQNWAKIHGGAKKQVAVLEDGLDVVKIGMPLEDAQFLEYRKFSIAEIARWFGVPPHKLRDLERATFSNIEEQRLEFFEDMLPWLHRMEQEVNFKLFSKSERESFFTEHIINAFLKADSEGRSKLYESGLRNGWLNRNEVRKLENLNTMGEQGDIYTIEANMMPLDQVGQEPEEQQQEAPDTEDDDTEDEPDARSTANALNQLGRILKRSIGRLMERDATQLRGLAKKPGTFLDSVEKHYDKFSEKMGEELTPITEMYRALGVEVIVDETINRHCGRSREAMIELAGECRANELADRVIEETENRPGAVALMDQMFSKEK